MVTVNGYTAEKMQEIADNTIVDASLSGDDLIFTKHDATTINVGSVRGFPGISDMTLYDPVGVVKFLMISAVPTGYGVLNASVEYEGTDYPILAAEYLTGAACVNGVCAPGKFRLPDMRGMAPFGLHPGISAFDTIRKTGGSKDAVVVTHNHPADQPAHDHGGSDVHAGTADHQHGTSDGGVHTHTVAGAAAYADNIMVLYPSALEAASGSGQQFVNSHIDDGGNHNHGPTDWASSGANHDHGLTIAPSDPAITVSDSGVSGTDKNLPPYRVGNWIMRLG